MCKYLSKHAHLPYDKQAVNQMFTTFSFLPSRKITKFGFIRFSINFYLAVNILQCQSCHNVASMPYNLFMISSHVPSIQISHYMYVRLRIGKIVYLSICLIQYLYVCAWYAIEAIGILVHVAFYDIYIGNSGFICDADIFVSTSNLNQTII